MPAWILAVSDDLDALNATAPRSWRARLLATFLIYCLAASGY
jgi:hypothetical protein